MLVPEAWTGMSALSTNSVSSPSSDDTRDSCSTATGASLDASLPIRCPSSSSILPSLDSNSVSPVLLIRLDLFSTPSSSPPDTPSPPPCSTTAAKYASSVSTVPPSAPEGPEHQDNKYSPPLCPPPPPLHGSTRVISGTRLAPIRRLPHLTIQTSLRPTSTLLSPPHTPGTPYNFPGTPVRELRVQSLPALARVTVSSLTITTGGTPEKKLALLRMEYSAIVGREKEALGRYHALCIFEEGDLEEVEFWRARAKVFSQWGKEFKYRIEDAEREVVKRKKERRRGGYWGDLVGGMFQ